MRVLFHYDAGARLKSLLAAKLQGTEIDVIYCPEGDTAPLQATLPQAEVIWHVLQPLTEDLLRLAPNLKLVQKIGVGVNTIDCDYAKAQGVAVCNMPGTNSRAVAEHALLLMLASLRKLPRVDRLCRSGHWFPDGSTKESFGEICGKRVGLVGFGDTPKALAPILSAMGAEVVYTARSDKRNEYSFLCLEELLATSDIVSLHAPLTSETKHLLNVQTFERMKQGAILVNTARGGLVDEVALLGALKSGKVGAAGLDVFEQEPANPDNPLFACDQVTCAPHTAWLTQETWERSIDVAIANVQALIQEEKLQHQVV
jgi:phosphoglycerate dehydrogenase-like enzyme